MCSLPTGVRSHRASPMSVIASRVRPRNSPLRRPVRASTSTATRSNRAVADGHVAGEDGVAGRRVAVVPFDDAVEEAAQVPQPHADGGLGWSRFAAVADTAGQEGFEAFNVGAPNLGDRTDVAVVVGEVDGQVAQGGVDQRDAARSHTDGDLGQVPAQRSDQLGGAGDQLVPVCGAARRGQPGGRGVCEQT